MVGPRLSRIERKRAFLNIRGKDFLDISYLTGADSDGDGRSVVAFGDLGMEAIYEFEVKDLPVTVAVDANGTSVHETGPREWQRRIGKIPLSVA